jgi:putative lipoic acid-binding regulatory protein
MGTGKPGAEENSEDLAARARALAVLEATHTFPCEYAVTVIAFNRDSVTEEVKRAVGQGDDSEPEAGAAEPRYESRPSSAGKYVSHRFAVWIKDSGAVLELYARLRNVEGVVTMF